MANIFQVGRLSFFKNTEYRGLLCGFLNRAREVCANLDYLIHETGRSGGIKKSSFEIETKGSGLHRRIQKVETQRRRPSAREGAERYASS